MILGNEINNNMELETTEEQKEIFSSLDPGHVVWALMPYDMEILEKIEESHRVRPYLVMYKDECNIYAYESSSSESKRIK